ncbi:MAG: hypothetical protein CFE45_40195, partial [Burkholderiales bacterium PBB5]
VGIMLVAFLSMVCGMILDTVTHSRRELKRLAYLDIPAPKWPAPQPQVAAAALAANGGWINGVPGRTATQPLRKPVAAPDVGLS